MSETKDRKKMLPVSNKLENFTLRNGILFTDTIEEVKKKEKLSLYLEPFETKNFKQIVNEWKTALL